MCGCALWRLERESVCVCARDCCLGLIIKSKAYGIIVVRTGIMASTAIIEGHTGAAHVLL